MQMELFVSVSVSVSSSRYGNATMSYRGTKMKLTTVRELTMGLDSKRLGDPVGLFTFPTGRRYRR